MKIQRLLKWGIVGLAGVFLVIQLVPYGRAHSNPPVLAEPAWDAPETREFARRACFDCHSNEVRWPWYAHVAPVSWLVQSDVDEGREKLNFSEWTRPQEEAEDAPESIRAGEMPLQAYVWLHPTARLDTSEQDRLASGLAATLGVGSESHAEGAGDEDDDDDDRAGDR
jgi:hypothetical protein